MFCYEDHARSLVSGEEQSVPFQIIWAQPGGLDISGAGAADEAAASAQERLDELLNALEHVGGSGSVFGEASGSGSGGGSGGGSAADPADVERLLALMLTPQDAYNLMNALVDYYVYGQAAQALEASRPLLEQELVECQRELERDQTGQAGVDSAQDSLDALDRQLLQYQVVQEQAKLIGERLTGLKLDGYDLAAVLQVFDVSELDTGALYDGALQYAQALAVKQGEVDEVQLGLDIKTQVLDLIAAFENIRAGQRELERTIAQLDETAQAYAMGMADKRALYSAQRAANDTAAALFQAMGAYTKLVNRLNDRSGGWLAKEYDWFAEPFGVLYETAVRQAQEAAEKEKQQAADPSPTPEEPAPSPTGSPAPEEPDPTPTGSPAPEEPVPPPTGSPGPEREDREQSVG